MANFHSDKWIMEQLNRHYQEALKLFPEDRIVGVLLDDVQRDIMKLGIELEMQKGE